MNQKECINVEFSGGSAIYDEYYGSPIIDNLEKYGGSTDKVVDIQGTQAHIGHDLFVCKRNKFIFDIYY